MGLCIILRYQHGILSTASPSSISSTNQPKFGLSLPEAIVLVPCKPTRNPGEDGIGDPQEAEVRQ